MKTWRTFITALTACAGLAPTVWAQVPPPPPVAVVAPAPAPAPVVTVWAKLGITPEGCARCKEKFCTSPLGQLINNGLKPVSALSGGIIGNCCPADLPKPSDLAKPPTSSEGAAAQIKKDEADAKARAAAVRYLGTVDCNWWPEAEAALIIALRADRNECVRYEAALALSRGCCCTPLVVVALTDCVNGKKTDNPAENSERVRMQAQIALTNCVAYLPPPVVDIDKEKIEKSREKPQGKLPEKPSPQAAASPEEVRLAAFVAKVNARPQAEIIAEARRALDAASNRSVQSAMLPTGSRSLADIWSRANGSTGGSEVMASAASDKRVEPLPGPQGEKYGGLLPALLRNTDSSTKTAENWRPGTVTYESTPMPSAPSYPMTVRTLATKPATAAANEWLSVPKLLTVLKESDKPAQREWAADCLAGADCSSHGQVIPALLLAARSDGADTVRVACIRTLDRMHAHSPDVMATLGTLATDPEPSVQKEASQTLSHLRGN